jgi:hypothetical protein
MAEYPTTFTNFALANVKSIDSNTTLEMEDSGSVILLSGADLTLPAASTIEGMIFTVYIADGSSDATIIPASGDGINGVINNGTDGSALISFDGTDDDVLKSASGDNNVGDRVTLISDGSSDWYILSGAGGWTQVTP